MLVEMLSPQPPLVSGAQLAGLGGLPAGPPNSSDHTRWLYGPVVGPRIVVPVEPVAPVVPVEPVAPVLPDACASCRAAATVR